MLYILAGALILLGTTSGLIFLGTALLRDFKTENALARWIPRWGKELIMCISGQLVAISMIYLGKLQFAPAYLVYISWAILGVCFIKFCFLIPDLVTRVTRPD